MKAWDDVGLTTAIGWVFAANFVRHEKGPNDFDPTHGPQKAAFAFGFFVEGLQSKLGQRAHILHHVHVYSMHIYTQKHIYGCFQITPHAYPRMRRRSEAFHK